jgi:hypothetical protein
VSSYTDKISEFQARISDIAAKLTSLADRRKQYSYAAASGDTRARKQLDDDSFEETSLVKEQQVLNSAVETALALEKQHELEAKQAEEHVRQVEANKCAQGVVALNEEIDLALVQLRELFERRAIILRSLGNTAVCDPSLLMRLSNRAGATSAAHHAGLGRHVNLEMMPVVSQRPLSDVNVVLIGIGESPSKPNGKGSNGSRRTQ